MPFDFDQSMKSARRRHTPAELTQFGRLRLLAVDGPTGRRPRRLELRRIDRLAHMHVRKRHLLEDGTAVI